MITARNISNDYPLSINESSRNFLFDKLKQDQLIKEEYQYQQFSKFLNQFKPINYLNFHLKVNHSRLFGSIYKDKNLFTKARDFIYPRSLSFGLEIIGYFGNTDEYYFSLYSILDDELFFKKYILIPIHLLSNNLNIEHFNIKKNPRKLDHYLPQNRIVPLIYKSFLEELL